MANKAKIVVGANFGDEGKGLVTDFLCSQEDKDVLVVRHNGGAQAGHTVTAPDGRRHVFKHFGSGSFTGAKTFLSRFFACNPILFSQEFSELEGLKINPFVYVDENSPITTPYDMMINQIVEEARGSERHGSCGVGFGETIDRTEKSPYIIVYKDLEDKNELRKKLYDVRKNWVHERLFSLGVKEIPEEWKSRLASEEILDRYIKEIEFFLLRTQIAPKDLLKRSGSVIFESAQGLMLDQDRGTFPNVTRSNTGIKNAVALIKEAEIKEIEVTYITRSYNTRHGAGPLEHELPQKPYDKIVDATNIFNQYQHSLRFAWLDADRLAKSIKEDFQDAPKSLKAVYNLAVTCLDQIDNPEKHSFISSGKRQILSSEGFIRDLKLKTGSKCIYTSHGPSRNSFGSVL